MKKIIFYILFISLPVIVVCQEYKPIATDNASIWHFAHKQLAGNFLDTIFVANKQNKWFNLYYHGVFFNQEKRYIGKIKISANNDKIWYIQPDGTQKKLVFDLNLQKNDTFDFGDNYKKLVVDSVFYENEKKTIEFKDKNAWSEKVKFIEGVGPNISFAYFYGNAGFLDPMVICKFKQDEKEYTIKNKYFNDCLVKVGTKENKSIKTTIFPNPVSDELKFKSNHHHTKNITISLFDSYGNLLFAQKGFADIDMRNYGAGLYFVKIADSFKTIETIKFIKQ